MTPPPTGYSGDYDLGRFTGTEYRKGQAGDPVAVDGQLLALEDPQPRPRRLVERPRPPWRALSRPAPGRRARGPHPARSGEPLAHGVVAEDPATGQIEVYDTYPAGPLAGQPRRLLAVYDPATRTAGDTDGTPNASPAADGGRAGPL